MQKQSGDFILRCFERTMPNEKKAILTMGLKLTEKHFTMAMWEKQFKGGELREPAIKITGEICSKITQRSQNSIDLNDPHHLLCFELIKWLITLSSPEFSEGAQAKVEQRINYLSAVIAETEDSEMQEMLTTVKVAISTTILTKLPLLSTQPASKSTSATSPIITKKTPAKPPEEKPGSVDPKAKPSATPPSSPMPDKPQQEPLSPVQPAAQSVKPTLSLQESDRDETEPEYLGGRFFPRQYSQKLKRDSVKMQAFDSDKASPDIALIPCDQKRASNPAIALARERYLQKLKRSSSRMSRSDAPTIPFQLAGPEPSALILDTATKPKEPKNLWNITETVTDSNIVRIVKELLTTSKSLLLQGQKIGGIGVHCLSELLLSGDPPPTIKTLNLSSNPELFTEITLQGQKDAKLTSYAGAIGISTLLKETTSLKMLSLSQCVIPLISLNFIANGLRGNASLEFLDLTSSNLDDEAAIALCRALQEHPTLSILLLGDNCFTDASAKWLIDLVTENKKIIDIGVIGNNLSDTVIDQIEAQTLMNSGMSHPNVF